MRNIIPSTNTAARASCHDAPIVNTTPNTKKAFKPIPGARAKGKFAHSPMTIHPMNAAIAVANKASSNGIPANESIAGFTTKMYAIVRNVATPALISVSNELPFSV